MYGNQWGKTVVFRTRDEVGKEYSEAFAGSGEVALAILVHEIAKLRPNSLVLLDEPEVSLHPSAQVRVRRYLLEQCLQKKLQIVVSTHSPSFIQGLPPTAIKVFSEKTAGRVFVRAGCTPLEAFQEIGGAVPGARPILVEDERAAVLLRCGLKQFAPQTGRAFDVQVTAGGVGQIYTDIAVYCREPSAPLIVLDGDQRPSATVDPARLPSEMPFTELRELVSQQTKGNDEAGPRIPWVGPTDDERSGHARTYLRFLHHSVEYLPGRTPEEVVWNTDDARQFLERYGVESADTFLDSLESEPDFKRRFQLLAEKVNGALTADTVFAEFVTLFAKRDREAAGPLSFLIDSLRRL